MRPSDNWIDETARALTEGEPPADFKARVLARIEHARPVRRFAWWPVAIASAAVAVIVMAIVVPGLRGPSYVPADVRLPPSRLQRFGEPGKPDTTGAGDVRVKADATSTVLKADATTEVRLKANATSIIRLAPGDTANNAPPTVPGPAPIEVADIEMHPLDVAAIEEPDPMVTGDIAIASIDVAPLKSITSQ
jgi:hypothetical protein